MTDITEMRQDCKVMEEAILVLMQEFEIKHAVSISGLRVLTDRRLDSKHDQVVAVSAMVLL